MRKNYIFIFIIFSFILFLFSCNKEEIIEIEGGNDKAKPLALETTYNAYVGDKFHPYYLDVNEYFTFSSSNSNIVSVDSTGRVECKKLGSANIYLYTKPNFYNENKKEAYCYVIINVIEEPKVDYNYNEELINEFNKRIDGYEIDDSISSTIVIDAGGESTFLRYQVRSVPMYFSYEEGYKNEKTIIKALDDGYYKFILNTNDKYYEKEYLGDLNYDISEYNILNYNDLYELKLFNFIKSNFEKINDNEYQMKFYFKDFIDLMSKYIDQGTIDLLKKNNNMVVTINTNFGDRSVLITETIYPHNIINKMLNTKPIQIRLNYDFMKFEDYDFSNYTNKLPLKIDDTYLEKDPKSFYILNKTDGYLYTYLEKGIYTIEPELGDISSLNITSYNENKEEINLNVENKNLTKSDYNINDYNAAIYVKDDGYYLKIYWDEDKYSGTKLKFNKLDYDLSEPENLKNDQDKLIGKYDYKTYIYNKNNENEILKIKIVGDVKILTENPISSSCSDEYGLYFINPKDGESRIHIISNKYYWENNDEIEYNMEVESIINDNNFDDEKILSDEYENDYFVGLGFENPKFLLNVTKPGYYEFHSKGLFNDDITNDVNIKINNIIKTGELFYLDVGQYELEMNIKYYYQFDIFSLKYVFKDFVSKSITLNKYISNSSRNNYLFEDEEANEIVRYCFNLNNDSYIAIDPDTLIFDEFGNAKTFENVGFVFPLYYKLKTGTYYATNDKNKIYIAYVDNNPSNYYSSDFSSYIIYSNNYKFDEFNRMKIFKIEEEIDTIVTIDSNSNVALYDEDLNEISLDFQQKISGFTLKANTKYYIIVRYDSIIGYETYFIMNKQ